MAARRLHLTFPRGRIQEPVIGQMTKQFDVMPNIRRANVDHETGWIDLQLEGEDTDLNLAITFLEEHHVTVDPVERDVVE